MTSVGNGIRKEVKQTYTDYEKLKSIVQIGYLLEDYVYSGGVVTKNVTYNNKIDVSEMIASLGEDVSRHDAVSFETETASTVYYLDYQEDGSYSWGTDHANGTYLPIAEVTTDANSNVNVITDKRGTVGGIRFNDDVVLSDGSVTDEELSNDPGDIKQRFATHLAETVTQIFNAVTKYDADPTGATDSTAKIQSALDDIESAGGGILFFPKGTYKTTYSLFYGSNLIIDGYGAEFVFTPSQRDATFLVPKTYTSSLDYIENVVMQGFKLNSATPNNGNGIGTPKAKNVTVRDVYTTLLKWHLVDIAAGKNIIVDGCHAENLDNAAFQCDNLNAEGGLYAELSDGTLVSAIADNDVCENVKIINCTAKHTTNASGTGVHLHREGGKNIIVDGCHFENLQYGILSDADFNTYSVTITNNIFVACNDGMYLPGAHHGLIIDSNQVDGDDGAVGNFGIAIPQSLSLPGIGDGTKNHIITNNIVKNCKSGILLDYSLSAVIQGNVLENITSDGSTVDYASSKSPTIYGISIYRCSNVSVQGNTFRDCPINGIRIALTTPATYVSEKMNISNNSFKNTGNAIVFTGYTLNSGAYTSPNCVEVIISGNIVELGTYGFVAFVIGGIKKLKILNNIIKTNNNMGMALDYCSDIDVQGNDVSIATLAGSGSRYGIALYGSRGRIDNNVVTGWESISKNIATRTADAIIEGRANELISVENSSKATIEYPASAKPSTSDLQVGSRAINATPDAAGYLGWVYTSTGWKGYGLIEA